MTYKLEFPSRRIEKQYAAFLSSFELDERKATVKEIEDLGRSPRPQRCQKIKDDIYRIRFGDWRVVYKIYEREKVIAIAKIGKRREGFYKEF